MSTVIQVDRLSKHYRLGTIGGKRLVDDVNRWWARVRGKEDPLSKVGQPRFGSRVKSEESREGKNLTSSLSPLPSSTSETLWALKDVSFEVKQGEVLGIIGRNGAGKSTLLKILSRVTAPTSGEARVKGRIASLLEVGTGFHPELTGRENIFLNGAILGMTKAEIRARFDEIVAFSEVEQFIDTPVKRYSSGMHVRLAFAVAAHLEPEILIVDEVLAVGDAAFQKRCLGKMQDVAGQGRTVLFVSHNMTALQNLCSRGILLDHGRVYHDASAAESVGKYLASTQQENMYNPVGKRRTGDQLVSITGFQVYPNPPVAGQPIEFVFHVERGQSGPRNLEAEFAVSITSEQEVPLLQLYSKHMGVRLEIPGSRSDVRVGLDECPLVPGRYKLNLWIGRGSSAIDFIREAFLLQVLPGQSRAGAFLEPHGYPMIIPSKWRQVVGQDVAAPGGCAASAGGDPQSYSA